MHVVPDCIVNNADEEIRVVEAVDGGSLSRRIKHKLLLEQLEDLAQPQHHRRACSRDETNECKYR